MTSLFRLRGLHQLYPGMKLWFPHHPPLVVQEKSVMGAMIPVKCQHQEGWLIWPSPQEQRLQDELDICLPHFYYVTPHQEPQCLVGLPTIEPGHL